MAEKLLLIINPVSGMRLGSLYLPKIISNLSAGGYDIFVMMTAKRNDAKNWAEEYGKDFDLIVACGGDGTFNEVVSGNLSGAKKPLGYIPCGTTNDFAASIGLSGDIPSAANKIANGTEHVFDTGSFGGRPFTYIASFGAFTRSSYTTAQSFKNVMGHLAYIVEGGFDIMGIKPEKVSIESNGTIHEGDYIFGAISNSTSIGGILSLSPEYVDMNDGLFEVMLIRKPENMAQLSKIVQAITSRQYADCDMIEFFSAEKLSIIRNPAAGWSLDGEFEQGADGIVIENVNSSLRLIC